MENYTKDQIEKIINVFAEGGSYDSDDQVFQLDTEYYLIKTVVNGLSNTFEISTDAHGIIATGAFSGGGVLNAKGDVKRLCDILLDIVSEKGRELDPSYAKSYNLNKKRG